MVLTGSTEETGVDVDGDFGMFVDPGRSTMLGGWVGQLSGARVHDVGEPTDDTVSRLHQ